MSGLSINDILSKIDQRLDDLRMTDMSAPSVSLDPLSEVGLYITNDPLLADLYRQYLESQKHYIASIQTHGKDAPMTEIASDMSESAFCAMETRLIELREEKELREKVMRVQETQRQRYVEEMKSRQAEYARRGIQQPQALTNIQKPVSSHKDNNNTNASFWALFAISFLQQENEMNRYEGPAASEFAHRRFRRIKKR